MVTAYVTHFQAFQYVLSVHAITDFACYLLIYRMSRLRLQVVVTSTSRIELSSTRAD